MSSRSSTVSLRSSLTSPSAKIDDRSPESLQIVWPQNEPVIDGMALKAGTRLGTIQVDVVDKSGESLCGKLSTTAKKQIPLFVNLTLQRHDPGSQPVNVYSVNASYGKWKYRFKSVEASSFSKYLGKYTLTLQSYFQNAKSEMETTFGDKKLPSTTIYFKVIGSDIQKFVIKTDGFNLIQRIGVPFNIPLEFTDKFGNAIKVDRLYSAEIKCKEELDIKYDSCSIKDDLLILKKVVATAKMPSEKGKEYSIQIRLPEINTSWVTFKIRFKPGRPAKLEIFPKENQVSTIENGTLPKFGALIYDNYDNIVTHLVEDNLAIACTFYTISENKGIGKALPGSYSLDFVTGPDGKECSLKGSPSAIRLKELSGETREEEIIAQFSIKNFEVPIVERRLKVVASCKPSAMKLFCFSEFDENLVVEISSYVEWTVGAVIKNIHLKIYDDTGQEIRKPNLSQSNVKLSWASFADLSKVDLKNGYLPDIRVSHSVEQIVNYNVNLIFISPDNAVQQQSVLEYSFKIQPRPGPLAMLKVTMPLVTKIPAGSSLSSDIEVLLADKFSNGVSGITELSCLKLKIKCDSAEVDEKLLKKELGLKEGVILVKNLKFIDTKLGMHNLSFEYENLQETSSVEVVPGPPKKLKWEFNTQWDGQIITAHRNSFLDISLQLYDDFGNICPVEHAKVQLGIDKHLELRPECQTIVTNEMGKAIVGIKKFNVVNDKEAAECVLNLCKSKCYGKFDLLARANCEGKWITSSPVKLHLLCDRTIAVKFSISYTGELESTAGGDFPEFAVSLLAEDGNTIKDASLNQLTMNVTSEKLSIKEIISPIQFIAGIFTLKVKNAPPCAGEYEIQFFFNDVVENSERTLSSEVLKFIVHPDVPVLFAPLNPPLSRIYGANSADVEKRVLVSELKFILFDKFNNQVEDDNINGNLTVEIVNKMEMSKIEPSSGDTNGEISVNGSDTIVTPLFEGGERVLSFVIKAGTTFIKSIVLQEKTNGTDGFTYFLRFTPEFDSLKVDSFALPFTFINEVEKKKEVSHLEKKLKKLLCDIKKIKDEIKERKRREQSLLETQNITQEKINELSKSLEQIGCVVSNYDDLEETIENKCKSLDLLKEKDEQRRQNFVKCSLPSVPEETGILGRIGLLAVIEDEQEAQVLSWHMQGDMECIVTIDTDKAKELNQRFKGTQQLLPLDGIFKGSIPRDWNGALPHQKIHQFLSFKPTGNPVFARCRLQFLKEPAHCQAVFGSLLGDTLIIDTIDDALTYRQNVVKYSPCPTILTRNGDRLRNNGKFGGTNRMPATVRYIFGLAPNKEITKCEKQVQYLKELREFFSKKEKFESHS
ncbi:structural maintenance of chromosomes flexible hinge domain-containing protein 1-like protein [Dinothrombium tinctorium]|uniref:Structural maintenance of chromosomes flexible hinge domain-containing protein 1-like protein n=1 Tax=Dinothrombium tinctorium TaxID=1965070 RepID=A0A443RQM6_9ACAR|nr:structural maintenance of chromosomes flexible hinge domain-containing protein 1-like protein [Dinothrombium tinctorium]RWS17584.1 structural maintenance of chromosomes flexible hinge domain-containing protein 1-like protein [Dinothrombium tinctorium]